MAFAPEGPTQATKTAQLLCFLTTTIASLLMFAAESTVSRADTNEAVSYHNQGFELMKAGNYREAFQKFSMAIAEDSKIASSYACRGVCYEAMGRNDLAIADFNHALRLDPKDIIGLHNRGLYFLKEKQYPKAIADLSKALALGDADPPSTYAARGICYNQTKQFDLALKDFNQALRLRPQLPQAYFGRAIAYFQTKEYARVFPDIDYAVRYDANVAKEGNLIGAETAIALKQYDKALSYLNAAVRLDPASKDIRLRRSQVYADKKDYKEALNDLNEVIRLAPQLMAPYKQRALIAFSAGNYAQAATDCDKYMASSPLDKQILAASIMSNAALGEWQKTSQLADKYLVAPDWSQKDTADVALVAYISYNACKHEDKARKLLDDAAANTDHAKWPYPLIQLMHHDLSSDELIKQTTDDEKATDAQAIIAFDNAITGDGGLIEEKIQWLRDKGKKSNYLLDLSLNELKSLKLSKKTSQDSQPAQNTGGKTASEANATSKDQTPSAGK